MCEDPQKVISRYGAEIFRLWVAHVDYREDVRLSQEILTRLTEAYRRIRNTCRFLLGNLYDFDPSKDRVAYAELPEIDRFMLHKLAVMAARVRRAYEEYAYHVFYHTFHNFCAVDLSAFYLDVLKDRLYTLGATSVERRAAQTVLYDLLHGDGTADGAGADFYRRRALALYSRSPGHSAQCPSHRLR